jgi:hypothetical protein
VSLERLNAIAKDRFTTGAHADEHLRVAPDTWEAMRTRYPKPAGSIPYLTGAIGNPVGIPVMFDTTVAAGAWQLVETATGNVVEEGQGPS